MFKKDWKESLERKISILKKVEVMKSEMNKKRAFTFLYLGLGEWHRLQYQNR